MQKVDTKKLLGMLGLAARARKLITGTELVTEAVRKQPAKRSNGLVLIAADASENTTKRIENCCTHYHVTCIRIAVGKDELSRAVGKMADVAVCALFEKEMANAVRKILEMQEATITEERKISEV